MSELLINSLEITGYRTFRHLEIPELGRVNLIVGKNNVGKTALLEALRLFADRGSKRTIRSILQSRDEFPLTSTSTNGSPVREIPWDIKNLFHGRNDIRTEKAAFQIIANNNAAQSIAISIDWIRYIGLGDEEEAEIRVVNLNELNTHPDATAYVNTLVANGTAYSSSYPLDSLHSKYIDGKNNAGSLPARYVPVDGLTRKELPDLWDAIALTDAEDLVIDSLKLLVADVQKLSFLAKGESSFERVPYVKLKCSSEPVQLRSTGEGVNRLLGLIIALVSSRNGLLLIDEVETGFHYSILPKVWRLIFETATKLNVQVFATTHSWECIEAFQRANALQSEAEGMLIRLEAKADRTKVTSFDKERLAIVTREQIEVR